jgi:hypothetical protein
MKNNKQQTAVGIIYQGISDKIVMQDLNKALICIHISHDDFLKLHKQAKEKEKHLIAQAFEDGEHNYFYSKKTGEEFENGIEYYNEKFKKDEQ